MAIVADKDQFMKTIISLERKAITMKVFRSKGIETILLSTRAETFASSSPGAAFVSVKKAVQKVKTPTATAMTLLSSFIIVVTKVPHFSAKDDLYRSRQFSGFIIEISFGWQRSDLSTGWP